MNKHLFGTRPPAPIGEADLHAFVDDQLSASRRAEVRAVLTDRPELRARVEKLRAQKAALQHFFQPIVEEPIPVRLAITSTISDGWRRRALAAGVAVAVVSAGAAWFARGTADAQAYAAAEALETPATLPTAETAETFYQRAAVAHAVYAPEIRHPVEVGGDQEQALAAWLSKRLGATIKPPRLVSLGYQLMGGRLLPGGSGPVAQFMYANPAGDRLTLYVTREAAGKKTGFQFTQDGSVNVFYWVDAHFGYAISGAADRAELLRVSEEVYKQFG
jgi:anti-sigma factor RsiW